MTSNIARRDIPRAGIIKTRVLFEEGPYMRKYGKQSEKDTCASKQDGLALATIRYLGFINQFSKK